MAKHGFTTRLISASHRLRRPALCLNALWGGFPVLRRIGGGFSRAYKGKAMSRRNGPQDAGAAQRFA